MKGQYFSFDAIIASVIFVLALVALLSYWHSMRSFLDYQNDPMTKEAVRISNLFFIPPTYSGVGTDCEDIQSLGFAVNWTDKRIDPAIVACAASNDEEWLYQKLLTPYKLTLELTNVSDNNLITLGYQDPPENLLHTVKIRRLASVLNPDGSTYLVYLDLSLYKEGYQIN
jgi:hypothetical protein